LRQLTGLDAQFLAMESSRQCGHVSMLMMVDPSTRPGGRLELEDVHALVAERLPLLPPFRWRLRDVPLGLDYPYWIDDPDFDLEYHVRELALPPPPTAVKLATQVARIAARPLDRSRPLWELYLIHGLEDGEQGIMTKVHHAAVDGMSGAEILGVLLDLSPEGREPPAPDDGSGDREPGELEMLARGLAGAPRYWGRVLRALPSTLPNLEDSPFLADLPGAKAVGRTAARFARALRGGESRVLERTTLTRPRTSFNGRVSAHRRLAYGQLSLDGVKAAKNEHGCTVNDVVVSLCAGAVRRWLIEHDELPQSPLVAQVPVSVRSEEQKGTYGNRVGVISAPLYTNEPDAVKRLRLTHEALIVLKEHHKALPASLLQDATEFIPPAVFARATRVTFSLAATRAPIWNLVISNVPGPQVPMYFAGAQVEALYPVSVITDGLGLNITVFSYCGQLDIGIVADREQMPDVWRLMDWLGESLDELQAPGPGDLESVHTGGEAHD
jgi:diacylglycerol O-acyltransferase / wax synthase